MFLTLTDSWLYFWPKDPSCTAGRYIFGETKSRTLQQLVYISLKSTESWLYFWPENLQQVDYACPSQNYLCEAQRGSNNGRRSHQL